MGAVNLAATLPYHASQLYAKNVANFVLNMVKNGELQLDAADEIVRDTMLARDGERDEPARARGARARAAPRAGRPGA